MVDMIKSIFLDVMFALYGILGRMFVRLADKCLDRRDDILDKLFT